MKFKLDKRAGKRKVDMTPMIDCVFQLLLFFLVASQFEEQARSAGEGELGANLPAVSEAMPMVMKPREIIVNVDDQGDFYLDGDRHTEQQLIDRLKRAENNNPGNQSVIIRGNEGADWKFVARVMGLCNECEITDYRVAVVPEGEM